MWRHPRTDEGVAEAMLGTDHNHHSPSLCATEAEELEKSGVKLSLGRGEAWGEVVSGFSLCFYLSRSDLTHNK